MIWVTRRSHERRPAWDRSTGNRLRPEPAAVRHRLEIRAGEVVALLSRNGMGKTTTIRSIMGRTPLRSGVIEFRGKRIAGTSPDRIARSGIALAPEGRQILPNLTVRENLAAFAGNRSGSADPWTVAKG